VARIYYIHDECHYSTESGDDKDEDDEVGVDGSLEVAE
jgi:hypothetical protein